MAFANAFVLVPICHLYFPWQVVACVDTPEMSYIAVHIKIIGINQSSLWLFTLSCPGWHLNLPSQRGRAASVATMAGRRVSASESCITNILQALTRTWILHNTTNITQYYSNYDVTMTLQCQTRRLWSQRHGRTVLIQTISSTDPWKLWAKQLDLQSCWFPHPLCRPYTNI